MVFCFSGIDFKEIVDGYGAMFSPGDIILLSREVVGRVDMPAELNGSSQVIKDVAAYSRERSLIIVIAMQAEIGQRVFNSAMVIDKGRIMGVSDELTPCGEYEQGKVMRSYLTTMGKICIFIDSDLCYPQLWQSAMQGARYVFCLCSHFTDCGKLACARALACVTGKYVLCKFVDCGICVNALGKVQSIKWGRMSAFYLPMSLALGKNIRRKVRFVEERGEV